MDEQKRALHALNRLTFGPRPGDVQQVLALGVDKWIDQELHPERIENHAIEARLEQFRTVRMSTKELVENFPPPQLIKAVMAGNQSLPSDPLKRAVYESQIDRMKQKQERKEEIAAAPPPVPNPVPANGAEAASDGGIPPADFSGKEKLPAEQMAKRREDRLYADLEAQQLLDLPPDARMKQVLQMSTEDQRTLAVSLKGQKGERFLEGMSAKERETMLALNNPQQVVSNELIQAKLLRAIYSERQLEEVMTDFWYNHFNIDLGKGADRYLVTSYERDVIRPHALGKFEDLLVATAKSPAMLFYLDNWLSVGPDSEIATGLPKNATRPHRQRFPQSPRPAKGKGKRGSGLNENYGRELMELHTLGVNGGYTQKDVTEVARVFTGWTIEEPRKGGGFKFEERLHEPGDKIVLGHRIKSRGEKEGQEVLHLLAHHPSTARFVSKNLAMRFVSDNPPPALVERMSQTFLKKDGDIREVLKTMLKSPEFWSDDAYRAKVKTPLEFVVSAARATGADVSDALPLARQLTNMGMPLYGMQPPTGYSMEAESWVNSSALLGRMNFSLELLSGKIKGVQVDTARLVSETPSSGADSGVTEAHRTLAQLETSLLAGDVSRQTHEAITKRLEEATPGKVSKPAQPPSIPTIAGLLLGSPEFQRR